ncbi:MAG: short chain dehydrogenase [Mycobacterium sp.]|nr:short chain dehydrogenase [Mycobacterium sp.]
MSPNSQQTRSLAVITGATGGVGLEIAKGLARAGYDIIVGARSERRGTAAVTEIRRVATEPAFIEQSPLDLASLASVTAFASALPERPIDRLVLNAGVMLTSREETKDGFEMMFGTNVLGHFALVSRILDRVLAAHAPRVITQSSESHRAGHLNLQDLQHTADFSPLVAYNDSKQAQHMLAVELDRRYPPAGSVVCQPGWVKSDLGRDMADANLLQAGAYAIGNLIIGQTPAQGARSALVAALGADIPRASSGAYITPGRFGHLRGKPIIAEASPLVLDAAVAEVLWQYATDVTNQHSQ